MKPVRNNKNKNKHEAAGAVVTLTSTLDMIKRAKDAGIFPYTALTNRLNETAKLRAHQHPLGWWGHAYCLQELTVEVSEITEANFMADWSNLFVRALQHCASLAHTHLSNKLHKAHAKEAKHLLRY